MESKQSVANLIIILLSTIAVIVLASSGYDSIECDPHSNRARTGRARLIESIPCDLSKQSYCNLPGEAYPWNAVKKFVYDNQGLVRRMYGDQRHIFVMQSELENEINFDDIKHTADKYSKSFNNQHKQQKPHTRQSKAKKITTKTTKRNAERKNYRSGDANESEPHFRPAQRPSATNSKQRTKPPKINVNDQSEKSSLIDNLIQSNVDALNVKVTTKLSSIVPSTSSTTIEPTTTDSSKTTSTTEANASENVDDVIAQNDESDRTANVDKAVLDLLGNITSVLTAASTTTLKTTTAGTLANETSKSPQGILKTTLNVLDEKNGNNDDEEKEEEKETTAAVSESTKEPSVTTTTEAQLYQDHAVVPTMNRRGVNACPVKEEVVAPFWGNNTRGEILALLNVYPFEQYINWEKCTHEHEQMYCRKGCRCEQQFRLHRLLAYNPLDACRGIFSDWFRFPSCCICKCYDIPFDYRVTSRSPRGSGKVLAADVENEDDDDDDDTNVEEGDVEEFSLFDGDEDENYYDDPE